MERGALGRPENPAAGVLEARSWHVDVRGLPIFVPPWQQDPGSASGESFAVRLICLLYSVIFAREGDYPSQGLDRRGNRALERASISPETSITWMNLNSQLERVSRQRALVNIPEESSWKVGVGRQVSAIEVLAPLQAEHFPQGHSGLSTDTQAMERASRTRLRHMPCKML